MSVYSTDFMITSLTHSYLQSLDRTGGVEHIEKQCQLHTAIGALKAVNSYII